jgi:hypothetical protein
MPYGGRSLDWLFRRSQSDQDDADDRKYSRSDQQITAFVRKVDCHDRHHTGVSNIRPCADFLKRLRIAAHSSCSGMRHEAS